MKFNKLSNILLAASLSTLFLYACSKEEKDEVVPQEFTSPTFDNGYLTVTVVGTPGIVDSVRYTNLDKGYSKLLDEQIVYYQFNNTSVLTKTFVNGDEGDQVECCVYINSATNVGVDFRDVPLDSIQSFFVNSNAHCEAGTY